MVTHRKPSTGDRLSERLAQKKWSQCEFAERLGISTSAVSRWISGERKPSLEMAFLLEEELGIPAEDWLLG
jgi:transcriptional regulator with XRE-family HTH domain